MHYLKLCDDINGCGKTYPGDLDACPHCKAPSWAAGSAQVDPSDYAYDIETYVNAFTCRVIHIATDTRWRFEISDRIDQGDEFRTFIMQLKGCGARLVGYNNVGFDYPVVHFIMLTPGVTVREIYDKAMSIIRGNDKFGHIIWDRDQIVPQLDLIRIWHFNKSNPEKGIEPTSLKALEVAMRMRNVEDLPFPVGTMLTHEQIDVLHDYNDHDVVATCYFYARSQIQIKLRSDLTQKFGRNFMNMSNTKIGETLLNMECEKAGIQLTEWVGGSKHKRQTIRPYVDLSECIFPYIRFDHPEFNRVLEFLKSQKIEKTKGNFEGLTLPVIDGLEYGFAKGGMHASVSESEFHSCESMQIVDVDVASYYPNLAIQNRIYADHLGEVFCDAFEGIYQTRKSYPKGSAENQAYKEALNASYGNSNNIHSSLFDSKVTMTTTVNGQLLLCMLVDQLIKVPGLSIIQVNTDGVTFYTPKQYLDHCRALCKWWEGETRLTLEEALYKSMYVRDVNSYLAVSESGKVKRIGAYAYERMDENPGTREVPYGKDPSALVVPKAAEAALVRGEDVRTFITNHRDPFDFMLRAKVPRSNKLVMRWPEWDFDTELASIIRYFVATEGGTLVKLAPPTGEPGTWKRKNGITERFYQSVMIELDYPDFVKPDPASLDSAGTPWDERIHTKNRSKHEQREMGICVGWRVMECSNADHFDWKLVNYDYYVAEAEKLLTMLSK